jgi:hypothetical protein
MTPTTVRRFWTLIESNQAEIPLTLDDQRLVEWLISEIQGGRLLNRDESAALTDYISNRLPLIRDLAMGY